MIKHILNKLATGFSDEEIILKHERNLRIYVNGDITYLTLNIICALIITI